MALTYNSLATTTVATSGVTQTITFSGISAAYTDLVLVLSNVRTSTASSVYLQINGDTATNYTHCRIIAGAAGVQAADNKILMMASGVAASDGSAQAIFNFMLYAGSSRKVILGTTVAGGTVAGGATGASWYSTAAITSISILASSGLGYTFDAGTTATIYGILRA